MYNINDTDNLWLHVYNKHWEYYFFTESTIASVKSWFNSLQLPWLLFYTLLASHSLKCWSESAASHTRCSSSTPKVNGIIREVNLQILSSLLRNMKYQFYLTSSYLFFTFLFSYVLNNLNNYLVKVSVYL